jgi:O-antigen/teichoic acid export membrane protein/glycosyltransferase involved in cell wall biosynthesis
VAVDTLNGDRKRRYLPASVRELARGTVPLLLALGLLNASNYIFHVAVSRLLGPADYGALASLLAVVIVLSVPLSVTQTVVAKRTAVLRASGRSEEIDALAVGTARAMAGFGFAGLIFLVGISPALAWFLRTEAGPAALLGPFWLLSLLLSVPMGVIQGRLRFTALGAVALLGVAVRLGAGIGLVWAGFGVTGAMLGTVLAQAASLGVAAGAIRLSRKAWKAGRASLTALRSEFGPALLTLGSFWVLAEIDVVLARRYLGGSAAGFYASAGLLARALLFLPAAISLVALPRFAESRSGEEAHRRLRFALVAVGGLVLLAYPGLVILREPLVTLAFGSSFQSAADLLPLLAAGMGLMAATHLLAFFHIAEGTKAYRLILGAVVLEGALILSFHNTGAQIGTVVLAVGLLTTAALYHAAVAACRWRPVIAEDEEAARRLSQPWLHGEGNLDLTVVLPCHNAGEGVRQVLNALQEELQHVGSWEIIVVSDGSTDRTIDIVQENASDRIRLIHEPIRIGKGNALRLGLGQARGKYVAFIDADGDIDPRAIRPALALMDLYDPEVVLGSKRHPLSEVQYPMLRRLMSWTYHKLCRLLFRVSVRDTQTGFKLIRRDVLATVLPRMLEKRYAFDLEFLVVARRLGYRRIFEAPIRIEYRFQSQVAPVAALHIVVDTLAIFYRRFILNTYRDGRAGDRGKNAWQDLHPSAEAKGADQEAHPARASELRR